VRIDLTELLQAVDNEADVEITEKVNFPEDELVLSKPVKISAHLVNTGPSIIMFGRAETEVELQCSRCLKTFRQPLVIELDEEFAQRPFSSKTSGEMELKAEDFVYPIEKDNTIDLTELLRQNLLLNLPIKCLCSPDCQGIAKIG